MNNNKTQTCIYKGKLLTNKQYNTARYIDKIKKIINTPVPIKNKNENKIFNRFTKRWRNNNKLTQILKNYKI